MFSKQNCGIFISFSSLLNNLFLPIVSQVSELSVPTSFLALVAGFFVTMTFPYGCQQNSPYKGGFGVKSGKNKLLKHILPLLLLLCSMTSSDASATTTSSNDNPQVSY